MGGLGFVSARRSGRHYELAKLAVNRLKKAELMLKAKREDKYEYSIVSFLQSTPKLGKNLITMVGDEEVNKITQVSLFGFKHRPDTTIGNDGTAIEIKVVTSGPSVRDLLGQALAYRMNYRFVILVLVDHTSGRQIVDLCKDKKSREYSLLRGFSDDFNIFTVVGPVGHSKNLVFI